LEGSLAFGVEHPLLDQFIKEAGVNSQGKLSYTIVSTTPSAMESARSDAPPFTLA
jgi:hypothetical protein